MDNLQTALVNMVCPLCGGDCGSQIVMNKLLTKNSANQIKEMHGKNLLNDEPCDNCKEYMEQGFLIIIVDENKTSDKKNPYRTGGIAVIRTEAAKNIFGEESIKSGACFLDYKAAEKIGLPTNYIPE